MLFRLGILRAGVSGLNLKNLKKDNADVKLPQTLKTGLALTFKGLTLTGEFDRQLIRKEDFYSVGCEIRPVQFIALRGGYKFNQGLNFGKISGGLGIGMGNNSIDYAFSDYGDLGITHRVGLSFGFGAWKEVKKADTAVRPSKEEPLSEEAKTQGESEIRLGIVPNQVSPAAPASIQPTGNPEIQLGLVEQSGKPSEPVRVEKPPVIAKPAVVISTNQINIAVADLVGKNVSPMDASIIGDFLRTELVNTGIYNVVEKANMEKILAEAAFQQSGCTTAECAVQIGKLLNVKQMVVGSLSKLMDTYYITVNLVDVETGKIMASYDQDATSAKELRTACRMLAQKLAE
jgi:hypothetical protein